MSESNKTTLIWIKNVTYYLQYVSYFLNYGLFETDFRGRPEKKL